MSGLIWFLPYLQVNKLTCYCLLEATRTHETPGSETKDYYSTAESMSIRLASVLIPKSKACGTEGPRWQLHVLLSVCVTA